MSLYGEPSRPGQIRIRTPEWLHGSNETFAFALNVDSMVEIDHAFTEEYGLLIASRTKAFLSINHEANRHRVRDLRALSSMVSRRFPYWMRDGYAEEIYIVDSTDKDDEIRSLGRKVEALKEECGSLQAELRAVQESTIWKVAALFRRLKKLVT